MWNLLKKGNFVLVDNFEKCQKNSSKRSIVPITIKIRNKKIKIILAFENQKVDTESDQKRTNSRYCVCVVHCIQNYLVLEMK